MAEKADNETAISRRDYGETVAHLTAPTRFPYQFCANYGKYGAHVDRMPVDANLLVALMAPRPLLLQTGDQDFWSDPKGEFLAAVDRFFDFATHIDDALEKVGLGRVRVRQVDRVTRVAEKFNRPQTLLDPVGNECDCLKDARAFAPVQKTGVEIVGKGFPVELDTLAQHRAGDVLDTFHQVDEIA